MRWLKNLFKTEIHNHYHNTPVAVQFEGGVLLFTYDEKVIYIKRDFATETLTFNRVN